MHLQMTLDEADYQSHVTQVGQLLAQPHVRGVYEERLALGWKTCLQLGCTAIVAPQIQGRPLAEGFTPSELVVRRSNADAMSRWRLSSGDPAMSCTWLIRGWMPQSNRSGATASITSGEQLWVARTVSSLYYPLRDTFLQFTVAL